MAINTISKQFFEDKYRASSDPWKFSSSSYELNRYDGIIHLLANSTSITALSPDVQSASSPNALPADV